MNIEIFYFSGTGNSYTVAKRMAGRLNAELLSIPEFTYPNKVKISSDVIGFVFPDYHSNVPNIVRDFVEKIETLEDKYVFGVCTYGHDKGPTMNYFKELIKSRDGKLSGGFAVKMPYNYIMPRFSFKDMSISLKLEEVSLEEQEEMFSNMEEKVEKICDHVEKKEEGKIESESELLFKMIDLLRLKEIIGKRVWIRFSGYKGKTDLDFYESRKMMDHGFIVGDGCIGCGTCERVCPVSNIELVNEKPTWSHNCEQCFACLQWCPAEAIQFGEGTEDSKRYHHPEVEVSDIMRRT